MSQPIVVAFDPGKTTGWAQWNYPEGKTSIGQGSWMEVASYIDTFVRAARSAHYDVTLVTESFTITQATLRKSRENWSLEFIGHLRYLADAFTSNPLVVQSPANAKSFATDEKLKNLGWYIPGKPHGTDAARHLLLYMVDNKLMQPQVLIS